MNYYTSTEILSTILGAYISIIMVVLIASLLFGILSIIGHWRVFSKAGEPAWGAIIPFFNSYLLHKITWGNGWVFLAPLLLSFFGALTIGDWFGGFLSLLSLVFSCITSYKLSVAFGKGLGFAVGLILLPWLFICILAFLAPDIWVCLGTDSPIRRSAKRSRVAWTTPILTTESRKESPRPLAGGLFFDCFDYLVRNRNRHIWTIEVANNAK